MRGPVDPSTSIYGWLHLILLFDSRSVFETHLYSSSSSVFLFAVDILRCFSLFFVFHWLSIYVCLYLGRIIGINWGRLFLFWGHVIFMTMSPRFPLNGHRNYARFWPRLYHPPYHHHHGIPEWLERR